MAFDPLYDTNRRFYVFYTKNAGDTGDIVIARYLRSDPLTTSKILINPSCWTMKRRVESPEGAVMKTGELRLVLIG